MDKFQFLVIAIFFLIFINTPTSSIFVNKTSANSTLNFITYNETEPFVMSNMHGFENDMTLRILHPIIPIDNQSCIKPEISFRHINKDGDVKPAKVNYQTL